MIAVIARDRRHRTPPDVLWLLRIAAILGTVLSRISSAQIRGKVLIFPDEPMARYPDLVSFLLSFPIPAMSRDDGDYGDLCNQ